MDIMSGLLVKLALILGLNEEINMSEQFINDLNSVKPDIELTKPKATHIDSLYNAVMNAEHRGKLNSPFYDPWIRTTARGSGSNAYGPVQVLSNTLGSMPMTKEGNPMINYSDEELEFIERYKQQGAEFYKHGMNEGKIDDYNPDYDYGGKGWGFNDADKALYESAVKKLMKYEYNRAGDLDTFIKNWRWGDSSDFGYDNDSHYYDIVREYMGE